RLDGWSLRGALASAQGTDQVAHEPLATVDPLRATLGLLYTRATWGVELAGRFAQRKDDVVAGMYRPAGYGVLDLLAHWKVTPGIQLHVGVFNLGDKTWTDWADVNGVEAAAPALARYTRPGRSLSASISIEW
ncbi:MAG: TonB-dependent receptor, partial [Rhodanobacteraceae bacterium]